MYDNIRIVLTNIQSPNYDEYETELIFTRETKPFYEVFLWFGQELARYSAEVRKEKAERCIQACTVQRTPERVHKRVLLGTFAETPNRAQGIRTRS